MMHNGNLVLDESYFSGYSNKETQRQANCSHKNLLGKRIFDVSYQIRIKLTIISYTD